MGIRDALTAVPTKPVFAAAFVITVLVAGWDGWNVHEVCVSRANLSNALHDWSATALGGLSAGARLDSVTDFEWDQVRISQGKTDLGPVQSCPFDWHWSNDQRTQMAEAGDLTLIGFFKDERLVEIADFDRSWAQFETDDEPIAREQAVFSGETGTDILRISSTD